MASVRQRRGNPADLPPRRAVVEELSTSEDEADTANETLAQTKTNVDNKNVQPKNKKKTVAQAEDDEDSYSPWLDILRVLSFLFLASCGLSYLVSGGETFFWGMKNPPKYLQKQYWAAQWAGPTYLTLEELAQYNGKDETKPLYIAINGTIFDVSSNRRTYGPGGSYQYFAGTDAARSFVTGCFATDQTADMRGVEDMFLPLDDPEVDRHWTPSQLVELKKQELEEARKRVHDGLAHWVGFFENSPRYHKVGYVKRPKNWLDKEPLKPLCEAAAKGRRKRTIPGTE
ncbi:uncharacterized protein B0I36DRAFT_260107 [Microdochium trichocladiopsis]|uniref:Cytochrome b5 heme-binding domain-containing protein n=1 Tax=Microdochium trichocladiopsis TaxID=1682393 RepID=A0A9P9C026_9PEZI|nr:uncharacterized protein B0I36DRAFT_260107 [Microdochium trichocladiopsis]KAH7040709.1 hypothetical protein B0I36DRAFT_260107 [Microdochium trichocladiopsis]